MQAGKYQLQLDAHNLFPGLYICKMLADSPGITIFTDSIPMHYQKPASAVKEYGNGFPSQFELLQNYPNPFNPRTTIKFGLPSDAKVTLEVYNTIGQKVETLVNEQMSAGYHLVEFNAGNLASGVYFYRMQAGSFVETKKLLLMK